MGGSTLISEGFRRVSGAQQPFAARARSECRGGERRRWRVVNVHDVDAGQIARRDQRADPASVPFLRAVRAADPLPRPIEAPETGVAPLLASGIAKFRHAKPWNPLRRLALQLAQKPALAALEELQGVSGGFMESIPQTSFVVMSLTAAGLYEHAVVRRGVEFLLSTVQPDGGWPSRRPTS